jgi:hypothetical protein
MSLSEKPHHRANEPPQASMTVINSYITSTDIKRKNRLIKVYVPATSATFLSFFSFFLAVAINSTNEANKAGGMCH